MFNFYNKNITNNYSLKYMNIFTNKIAKSIRKNMDNKIINLAINSWEKI